MKKSSSLLDAASPAGDAAVDITFTDIKFSVQLKSGGRLDILKGVSGRCQSGLVQAIMGSSGAGKTTLLDLLACNSMGGQASGQILVNGAPRRAATFQRLSCYVLQREVLLSSATVRESITTAALLKLPRRLAMKEKMARVDRVLQELGLVECQNTLIGDEILGIKGISGGQRRRVSIGIELVKDPRVIFLDEPTSGLDSEMAVSLVHTLKDLATLGRTVVLTIHQPNSLITSQFDDFMLLAGGQLVYGGPWSGAVPHFAAAGHTCPAFSNPTDFFLSVVQEPAAVEALVEAQRRRDAGATTAAALLAPGDVESGGKQGEKEALEGGSGGGVDAARVESASPESPFWYQGWVLTKRNMLSYLRNPLMLFSETAQYAFMGLFVGLMYLQLNNSLETGVPDRAASIWFGMAVLSFTPSFTAATVWDRERVLLRREVNQNLYTPASWFLARTAITVPMQIIQTLLFGLISYFMCGYVLRLDNVLVYLVSYALFQITSETIGMLCAAATRTSTMAVLMLTFVLLILLSFSGFLVSDIPVYFKWVRTISYLTYAYSAIVQSEFKAVDFVCTLGPPGCVEKGAIIPGADVIPIQLQNGLTVGGNLLVLLGICVGSRIFAYLAIWVVVRFKHI